MLGIFVRSYDVVAFRFQAGTTSFRAYTMPPAVIPLAWLFICLHVKICHVERPIRTDHLVPLYDQRRDWVNRVSGVSSFALYLVVELDS